MDEIDLQRFKLRMAYQKAHYQRVQNYLFAAVGGMFVLTALSLYFRGVNSDLAGLGANLFGLATVVPTLADGRPIRPPDRMMDVFGDDITARFWRTQKRLYYGSFVMIGFWLLLTAWRIYSLASEV